MKMIIKVRGNVTARALPGIAAMGLVLVLGCSPGSIPATSASIQPKLSETSYRLGRAEIIDTAQDSTTRRGLRLLASGSTKARIVDEDLNVLISAPRDGTIFSMRMSPSQEQILVHYGDAKYEIVATDSLTPVASLPVKPPGQEGATGFSWRWLNENRLLGSAALPSTDTQGKTMAEIEGLPPRSTLLYIYQTEGDNLIPVQIDAALPQAFMIHQTSGWNITLLTHDEELVGAKVEKVASP